MANGFSFQVNGFNGTLSYRDGAGFRTAGVRMKTLSYNYGVTSTESHARDERAFYPHRRVQGQFSVTLDCKGYREFKQLMSWLQVYTDSLLNGALSDGTNVTLMDVALPARNFHKIGILTTGIDDHNQVGSMVFNPELIFAALADPQDPSISLLKTPAYASGFRSPQVDSNLTTAFYPVTVANYKDSLLYDDLSAVNKDAAVKAAIGLNPVDAQFFANQKDSAYVQAPIDPVAAQAHADAKGS